MYSVALLPHITIQLPYVETTVQLVVCPFIIAYCTSQTSIRKSKQQWLVCGRSSQLPCYATLDICQHELFQFCFCLSLLISISITSMYLLQSISRVYPILKHFAAIST